MQVMASIMLEVRGLQRPYPDLTPKRGFWETANKVNSGLELLGIDQYKILCWNVPMPKPAQNCHRSFVRGVSGSNFTTKCVCYDDQQPFSKGAYLTSHCLEILVATGPWKLSLTKERGTSAKQNPDGPNSTYGGCHPTPKRRSVTMNMRPPINGDNKSFHHGAPTQISHFII